MDLLDLLLGTAGATGPTGTIDPNANIVGVGPNVSSQFSELRVSQRTPLIELTSVYGLSDLRDIVTVTGTGSVGSNNSEFQLTTIASGTDSAILQSSERGRYEPGFSAEAGIGIRLPVAPTGNQVVRWGVFDEQNGMLFGQDVTNGIFVAIRRAGVDTVIPQSLWNVDPLNGTGPSGETLNLAKGNIFQVVYTWYGYGVIEFRVVLPNPTTLAQEVITVHRYSPTGQTNLADPNLPLRAEIFNNGTAAALNLFVGGRQFSILGAYNPVYRVTSDRRTVLALEQDLIPIVSFQRKAVFPAGSARSNSVSIKLKGVDLVHSADICYQVILGGTMDGEFVNFPTDNTSIPLSETALTVNNTLTTISGGQVLFQGLVAGTTSGSARISTSDFLPDFQLPDTETITLAVYNLFPAVNDVHGIFSLTEEW